MRHRVTSAPRGVAISEIEREHTPVWEGQEPTRPLSVGEGEQIVRYVKVRSDDDLDRIAALERDVEPLRALRKWLWASSISVVLGIVIFFWQRGDLEGEHRQRLHQAEVFIEELRHDVRELERALSRRASVSPAKMSPDAISSASEGNTP